MSVAVCLPVVSAVSARGGGSGFDGSVSVPVHYGGFPEGRMPHRDFTREKRHFADKMNRPSEAREQAVRPRVEPTFTSPHDRPHGKRFLHEAHVFYPYKLSASQQIRGCRHYPDRAHASGGAELVPRGKHMLNGAQTRSSLETSFESTLGRITRLTENDLHARNESGGGGRRDAIEYTLDFYKKGACVPAVDMHSKASKSGFGFATQDLKAKRISEKLWAENSRRNNGERDERKNRTYREVAAERTLHYEQQLVVDLPDAYTPPVSDLPPPPIESPPPEGAKKRVREKKAKAAPVAATA